MGSLTGTTAKRLPGLDVLRAVACFLVIVSHSPVPGEANAVMRAINRGGWVGVDLFFVLSGFLVSGLMFAEYGQTGTVNAFRFAMRRALKIYPAFYFYLVITTIAIFILADDLSNIHIRRLAAEALFVQNYFPSTWGHTWSLAVEEHFYISIIVRIYLMVSRRPDRPFRGLPVGLVAVCISCLCWRLYDLYAGKHRGIPHTTHLRIDALSFGVLLAYCRHTYSIVFLKVMKSFRALLLIAGIALMLPAFLFGWRDNEWITTYGLTTNYLGAGCIVAAMLGYGPNHSRLYLMIARIGTYSYSIYLWHAVVANWIIPRVSIYLLGLSPNAGWLFSVGVSIAIGVTAAHIVEIPVLRIRDRLVPSDAMLLKPDDSKM